MDSKWRTLWLPEILPLVTAGSSNIHVQSSIIQQSSNKGIEIIFNHPTKSNKGVELMDFFFLRLNPLDLVTGKLWRRKTTSTASGCTAVMDPRPMG
jgi:hypothetical protein